MNLNLILCGVLLFAAPVFSQVDPQLKEGKLDWFTLQEDKVEIARKLGVPRMVAAFGADFESWQFQIAVDDTHEFSHQVVFRTSDHSVVSVTRNYETERNVDEWFPEKETTTYRFPDAEFSVRVRRLPGARLLMAMGVAKPGQVTGQIVMMRESELRYFYPWLAERVSR